MKRFLTIIFVITFAPNLANAQNVYVTVRETQLRPKADFLSKGSYLKYGDSLSILDDSNSWLNVKTVFGKQGYVHKSAVTEKRIVLKSGSTSYHTPTSQSDVVLAGKGFNQEVEKQFALQNSTLNFRDVDIMEKPRVAPNDLSAFVLQGKLKQGSL